MKFCISLKYIVCYNTEIRGIVKNKIMYLYKG